MQVRAFLTRPSRTRHVNPFVPRPESSSAPLPAFISALTRIMAREPSVFLDVVARVCTLERGPGGERLVKLRPPEKDKEKVEKEGAEKAGGKEKEPLDKDKGKDAPARRQAPSCAAKSEKPSATPRAKDEHKAVDRQGGHAHKKIVPASFAEVIDCLVDVVMAWRGPEAKPDAKLGAKTDAKVCVGVTGVGVWDWSTASTRNPIRL